MSMVMQGAGFNSRQVFVNDIVQDRLVAACSIIGTNTFMEVQISPVRTGRAPRRGESWLVEKQGRGTWEFTALISPTDVPVVPPVLFGSGPPDDKEPDFAGQDYLDVESTGGASRWRFTDGGWSVISGSAGPTSVPIVTPSAKITVSEAQLVRRDSTCILSMSMSFTGEGETSFLIPQGYLPLSPASRSYATPLYDSLASQRGRITISPSLSTMVVTATASGSVTHRQEWTTLPAWPMPLSGT